MRAKKKNPTTPPPVEQPSKKPDATGSALRPDDFPDIAQLANLAGVLAYGKLPDSDTDARRLTQAALRLWRNARDEINEQRATAREYWQKIDEAHAGIVHGHARVRARLQALGKPEYGDRETVAWNEAAALLWQDTRTREQNQRLDALVGERLAGKLFWREWKVEDFREHGFTNLAFHTLIQVFNDEEAEKEKRAESEKMMKVRSHGTTKKKAPKKEAGWGDRAFEITPATIGEKIANVHGNNPHAP